LTLPAAIESSPEGLRYDRIMAKTPLAPRHPERICWGCDLYCPADSLACGNGTIRTPHPVELFGEDWVDWSENRSRVSPESETPLRK
jgi:hypothetical protein